jgi:hypothetical protein
VYAAASEVPLSHFMTVGDFFSTTLEAIVFGDRLRNGGERAERIVSHASCALAGGLCNSLKAAFQRRRLSLRSWFRY